MALQANYFEMQKKEGFKLCQFHIAFDPDTDVTDTRKKIMRDNREVLNLRRFTFDGASLYTSDFLEEKSYEGRYNDSPVAIEVRKTGIITPENPQSFQIFNLVMRDCLNKLDLKNIKRNYFDPQMKIDVSEANLELWPGYLTSIRAYENEKVLLNVEIIHKFMRKETIYNIFRTLVKTDRDWKETIKREVVGTTVLTDYTNKTYLIDDIDFTKSPKSQFKTTRGNETSYADYYKDKYSITIKDLDQFLLVSRARERDIRAGQPELIYLIPELSRATGKFI